MKTTTLLLSCLIPAVSSQAARIAFISFHPTDSPDTAAANAGFTSAPDIGYTSALAAAGHEVTRFLTSAAPNVATLNTFDLVIVSRSVPSGNYQFNTTTQTGTTAAWNGITAPMMLLGGYIIRDNRLGFMAGTTIPDVNSPSVSLKINDPNHPIFAGVTLDSNNITVNPYATIQTFTYTGSTGTTNVTQRGISVVTGGVDAGGTILATVGTTGDAALNGMIIGEWQAGTTVTHDTGSATLQGTDTLGGHRLVFLTGSREGGVGVNGANVPSDGAGMYDLTTDGRTMFLNAVNYMAVPEPSTYALLGVAALGLIARRRKS
jgi:hypothetical protein